MQDQKNNMKMPEEQFGVTSVPPESSPLPGIALGVLIIALIFILGGLYVWSTMLQDLTAPSPEAPAQVQVPATTTTQATPTTTQPQTEPDQSTPTQVAEEGAFTALEAELTNLDFANLEEDINDIDAAFNAPQ